MVLRERQESPGVGRGQLAKITNHFESVTALAGLGDAAEDAALADQGATVL
jgi:hypothetical protein